MPYQPLPEPKEPARRQFAISQIAIYALFALAMGMIMLTASNATPVSASFSINTTDLMTQASDMFNQLWPVFAIIIGLSIGIALVGYIANKFMGAFKGAK